MRLSLTLLSPSSHDEPPNRVAIFRNTKARTMGFEPTIFGGTVRRFKPLSYAPMLGWRTALSGNVSALPFPNPCELSTPPAKLDGHLAEYLEGFEPSPRAWKACVLTVKHHRYLHDYVTPA